MPRRLPTTLLAVFAVLVPVAAAADSTPTLEQIMADPIWIGKTPQNPYWSADSTTIYYEQARDGESDNDLVRLAISDGEPTVIEGDAWASVDHPRGAWSADRRRYAFSRFGDLFVRDVATGALRQITRTGGFNGCIQC